LSKRSKVQKLSDQNFEVPTNEEHGSSIPVDSVKNAGVEESKMPKLKEDLDMIEVPTEQVDSAPKIPKKTKTKKSKEVIDEKELQKSPEPASIQPVGEEPKTELSVDATLKNKIDKDEEPTSVTEAPQTTKKVLKPAAKLPEQHVDRPLEKDADIDLKATDQADKRLEKKTDKGEELSTVPDSQKSDVDKIEAKETDKLSKKSEKIAKPATTTISPALSKEQSKEKMIVRMLETVTESSSWSSPKGPQSVPQSAASDLSGKPSSEPSDGGTPSSSQSRYEARRLREERASTPDNFKFVQLRKVQRVQKPVKKGRKNTGNSFFPLFLEVVEQPIKPKFNPRRKMISTSVGGVVVASVKLMASPEPKVSLLHYILYTCF
jgi:hypothetical protein